jgi:signal transduction histidine kinase/AmiR/NasT family two-component response regulator
MLVDTDNQRWRRERAAREQAERLLEQKSRELYDINERLRLANEHLERRVAERTAELRRAMQRAEEIADHQTRLAAVMSHELRTPLNAVTGIAQMLQRESDPAGRERLLGMLIRCSDGMAGLINDVLDMLRAEAGHASASLVPFAPDELHRDIESMFQPLAADKGLALRVEIAPAVAARGSRWRSDLRRLRQILTNLVGNAVKFTERGSVSVMLDIADGPGGNVLRWTVQDTGIGMSPAHLARLFKPFSQADENIGRYYGGSGLGLSIAARFAEHLGGRLWATSTLGAGSLFHLEVPAEPTDQVQAAGEVPDPSGLAALAGRRVLLVEDNDVNRMIAAAFLEEMQVRVEVADCGENALAALAVAAADDPVQIVLMDVHMPGMGGLEATRCLRRLALAQRPWVIGLTANAQPQDRSNCLQAGMDDFLQKPFLREDLQGKLLRAPASGAAQPGLQP